MIRLSLSAVFIDIVNSKAGWMLSTYLLSVMGQVNIEDIFTVISLILIVIKVIWNQLIALLFIAVNFISRSSFKSNCLTKFTDGGLAIQVILSCIVNVGNLGYLRISMVCYCNFNILIAKLEGLFFNRWFIRRIANDAWRIYTVNRLSVIIAPSCLASYIIFGTCFVEGNRLSFIWLSRIAIIIKIMNRTCYSIISSYIFSVVLNMIINNNSLIQTWNNLCLRTCPVTSPLRIISPIL